MASKSKRLRRIAEVSPGCIDCSRHTRQPNHCILSTAVGIEVCRQLGIEAHPLSVEAGAVNAAMSSWLERGKPGSRPAEAWGVGVLNDASDHGGSTGSGWDGHLVIDVPGVGFLDLNSGQFSRPEKDIDVPPGFFHGVTLGPDFTGFTVEAYARTILLYRRSVSDSMGEKWKTSPDWERAPEYAEEIARGILLKM